MEKRVEIAIVRGTVALAKQSKHYPQALDFIQDLIDRGEATIRKVTDTPYTRTYILDAQIIGTDATMLSENFEFKLNQIPDSRVEGLEIIRGLEPALAAADRLTAQFAVKRLPTGIKQLADAVVKDTLRRPQPTAEYIQKGENALYRQIKAHLDKYFIETEKIARILSLAIEGQKNCILWGDAGHGKSKMVEEAIKGLELSDDCFVQSFGEGMDEARLFGGLDFAKFKNEDVIEYNTDRSFLNRKIAVFEEIFDSPAIVLLVLKDTLTARELRNGAQRCPMKTECIIGLTNRSPAEISELGAAAHALIERFPLQLEVKWDRYDTDIYKRLFAKVKPEANEFMRETLAEMCADVHDKGGFISPRSAIHALETLIIAANGTDFEDHSCFKALAYVPGFERVTEGLAEELERKAAALQASREMKAIAEEANALGNLLSTAHDSLECLALCKDIQPLHDKLSKIKVSDGLIEPRNNLQDFLNQLLDHAQKKALDMIPKESHDSYQAP